MNPSMPRRSHVLLTLGILFTLGGATRFIPEFTASAEGTAADAPTTLVAKEKAMPDAPPSAAGEDLALDRARTSPAQQVCFTGETAALLSEDRWLFESGGEPLKEEKLALKAWETELQKQTEELKAVQAALDARWQEMQQAADADIQHLAAMYGTMKADQAAAIFNQMDPGFAAGFLRVLPSEQAGLILAGMQSDKAYVVSVKLASFDSESRAIAAPR